jgi:Icc-related predicted phosphoesterase
VIPGHLDAPEERYFLFMQQTAFQSDNIVLLHENTLKLDAYLFTGFGGEITQSEKEDYFVLQYPRQEVLFGTRRMRFLNPPRILLFYTPPVSTLDREEGTHKGNAMVNEIIESVAPSFLFCGQASVPGVEEIGHTVVVNPGALSDGHFAVVNTKLREAKFFTL